MTNGNLYRERDEAIVAAYLEDTSLSVAEVAERFEVGRSTAYAILTGAGVALNGRRSERRPYGSGKHSMKWKLDDAHQQIRMLREQARRLQPTGMLPDGRLRYVLPTAGPDRSLAVEIPADLSQAEADRLCLLISSLVCDEEAAP